MAHHPTQAERMKVRKLMTFRIIKEKLLYIIGIPRRFANPDLLRSHAFCGQFGQPERIVINHNPKDVYEGQVAVYVHYKSPINVAIALKVSHPSFHLTLFCVVSEWTAYE